VVEGEHWDGVDALFAKYENRPLGEKKRLVGEAVPFGCMGTAEDLVGMAISQGIPFRRTAVQLGCQDACAYALGDFATSHAAHNDDGLCDADQVEAMTMGDRICDARRKYHAGGRSAHPLPPAGEHFRRRLYWQSANEPA
jgi:hypothetical protein